MSDQPADFIINTDGASRGNPGQAAAAFIITPANGSKIEEGVSLGIATNNQAEYTAVKMALERLKERFSTALPALVEIRADSSLIVNQLAGKFKIKNPQLISLFSQIRELEKSIGTTRYLYVPREQNFEADRLANQALDRLNSD